MNNRQCILSLIIFIWAQSSLAADWPKFELTSADLVRSLKAQTIDISHDPVYKSAKQYQAYLLSDIINKLAIPDGQQSEDWMVVFTATDGYKVAMTYPDALQEQGYIAFKDNSAGSNNWLSFKFGKKTITPEPYYLVWSKAGLDEWRYPWPFQLVTVSLQPATEYYGAAAPTNSNNPQVKNGFSLFSRYCIRCHSVNLAGGSVGPELNIPKNVSEYFKEQELAGFIRNAPAYRAGTKMPSFEVLISAEDTQAIVHYLNQKKYEKIQ